MSDIEKQEFIKNKSKFLEGYNTLEELCEDYGIEGDIFAYVLILNPDHPDYDNNLSNLEMGLKWDDPQMNSYGNTNTKCGFDKDLGEVGRIGIFNKEVEISWIKERLGDVVYDIYKIE